MGNIDIWKYEDLKFKQSLIMEEAVISRFITHSLWRKCDDTGEQR